jgi:peptidyl-prolyl cis-trans isomerase-like 4
LKLSKIRYYEYCLFHRIEKDFIAQTGDPTATGKGGDSVFAHFGGSRFFDDELADPALVAIGKHVGFEKKGVFGMANSGRNKNASQFFMTLADGIDYLDEKYTAFAVLDTDESFRILELINNVICDGTNKPLQKVWIQSIKVLADPYEDHAQLAVPETVEPNESFKRFSGIDAAEAIERESEIPADELEQRRKKEEAEARALTLEMIGDLPSADVKPPENVLFVCKLNPMTEDEDLKTVFSRFGSIVSCQIIRDRETGNSLGYAFVEFEQIDSCEEAYLKMDNVLLDDRRIHVDFSQSVSKLHGLWEKARRRQNEHSRLAHGVELKEKYKKAPDAYGYEMLFDPRDVQTAYSDSRRPDSRRTDRDRRDYRTDDRGYYRGDRRDCRIDDRDSRRDYKKRGSDRDHRRPRSRSR